MIIKITSSIDFFDSAIFQRNYTIIHYSSTIIKKYEVSVEEKRAVVDEFSLCGHRGHQSTQNRIFEKKNNFEEDERAKNN